MTGCGAFVHDDEHPEVIHECALIEDHDEDLHKCECGKAWS